MVIYRILGGVAWACESMSRSTSSFIPGDIGLAIGCGVALWIGLPEVSVFIFRGVPDSIGNPWLTMSFLLGAIVGLGLILYMRVTRFVVFKKGAALQVIRRGASSPTEELRVWVTGYFRSLKKRRHFNVVPCRLEPQGILGWSAQATIDTSQYLYGALSHKQVDEWKLSLDLGSYPQIEEGTILFGSKIYSAVRIMGGRTREPVILGFPTPAEQEAFCRLNALSRYPT
jgi:hypothetical protein